MNSILTTIKKLLGIEEDYTHFDGDIIVHINSALLSLNQLGVGPADGFYIIGKEECWSDLTDNNVYNMYLPTYIYLKVKLVFDPPSNSFVIESFKRQIEELEWILNLQAER